MKKRKVTLSELNVEYKNLDYLDLYKIIISEIEKGNLSIIKNSGTNGKKPALYNSYWKVVSQEDYSEYIEELKYFLEPELDNSFYLKNLEKYKQDRKYVLKVNDYFKYNRDMLEKTEAVNERSFEIFRLEKYIDDLGGRRIIARLGLDFDKLNMYETSIPMSYYTVNKNVPQTIIIIENKDTFYSMRKYLIENNDTIFGHSVGTLVYGGGKGIFQSFLDYANGVEPYFQHEDNRILYYGDIDYEGISIYYNFSRLYRDKYSLKIDLWKEAYEKMLSKACSIGIGVLPNMKAGQNEVDITEFVNMFVSENKLFIESLLAAKKYIPQEILNQYDY